MGGDSSVSIATGHGLDGPGIESRWGSRFSAPVQTGPGAHPASCTMGTGSFPGVNRPGRDVDHPSPSSAEVKERVELYLYSPSRPSCLVLGWPLSLSLLLPLFYSSEIIPTRCNNCVYSSQWVELSPETCRVKPLRRINAIVASCWNYFTIKHDARNHKYSLYFTVISEICIRIIQAFIGTTRMWTILNASLWGCYLQSHMLTSKNTFIHAQLFCSHLPPT